jgi:hypothetical protein
MQPRGIFAFGIELAGWNDAFRLKADVNHDLVLIDAYDGTLDCFSSPHTTKGVVALSQQIFHPYTGVRVVVGSKVRLCCAGRHTSSSLGWVLAPEVAVHVSPSDRSEVDYKNVKSGHHMPSAQENWGNSWASGYSKYIKASKSSKGLEALAFT